MTDLINIKPLDELPDFPNHDTNLTGLPANWGYAVGGHGLLNDQPHLYHVMDGGGDWDFIIDIYLLPFCVDKLINVSNVEGYREAQRDIRNSLGITS